MRVGRGNMQLRFLPKLIDGDLGWLVEDEVVGREGCIGCVGECLEMTQLVVEVEHISH